MASTPETKAKQRIVERLKAVCSTTGTKLYYETHAGESYSSPTLDITGTLYHPATTGWGVPFAIEVKRFDTGGKLTERQRITMRDMARSGIAVFLIDSEQALSRFIIWITLGCPKLPTMLAP